MAHASMSLANTDSTSWIAASEFPWQQFPNSYADWLQHPGSLTQRFRELSQGVLQHQLLFTGWKDLESIELTPLHMLGDAMWTREIVFYGKDQPWEWARTIIPKTSLADEGKAFMTLGNKPIGDILFKDPELSRTEFEIAQLNSTHPYVQEVKELLAIEVAQIWARRSVIYFKQKPILIYELFLPAVMEAITQIK